MHGHACRRAVAALPVIGGVTFADTAISHPIARRGVADREITRQAHHPILHSNLPHRRVAGDPREQHRLAGRRAVGSRPCNSRRGGGGSANIHRICRTDIVEIESDKQGVVIGLHGSSRRPSWLAASCCDNPTTQPAVALPKSRSPHLTTGTAWPPRLRPGSPSATGQHRASQRDFVGCRSSWGARR